MLPKISFVIPVYNAEQYLRRCLDSVLSQTYSNYEIVLVDDGSTDRSACICDDYARDYSNVSVYHIPNGGASLARKKGIDVAQGEYLTFVDSDDYIAPDYLSILYHLIERYKTKLSACGVKRTEEREKYVPGVIGKEELLTFEKLMPRFFKYEFWGFLGGYIIVMYFKDLRSLRPH